MGLDGMCGRIPKVAACAATLGFGTQPRLGLNEMRDRIPELAACRRKLGLWDEIPLGFKGIQSQRD